MYEQYHLRSSRNLGMHKIKPGKITVGTIKNNFKGTIERFAARGNAVSFTCSVKGTSSFWKQVLYDVLAMVRQLGILTYFLTSSCADIR